MQKRREGLQTNEEAEMDVTTRTIGSPNTRHSGDFDTASPPAYDAEPVPSYAILPPRPAVAIKDAEIIFKKAPSMLLEGDTN